jgi:hypothetical protein
MDRRRRLVEVAVGVAVALRRRPFFERFQNGIWHARGAIGKGWIYGQATAT